MKKICNKLLLKFLEVSLIKGFLILCGLLGITEVSIILLLNMVAHYKITITLGEIFGVLIFLQFINLILKYFSKRSKSQQIFNIGTQVILKNGQLPVMVISKYNFWNNKVLSVWFVDKESKEKWFNQEVLKEYKYQKFIPPKRINKNDMFSGY